MVKLERILTSSLLVCYSTNQETKVQNCRFPKASGYQNKDSYPEVLVPKSMHFPPFHTTPKKVVYEMGSFFWNKCHKVHAVKTDSKIAVLLLVKNNLSGAFVFLTKINFTKYSFR